MHIYISLELVLHITHNHSANPDSRIKLDEGTCTGIRGGLPNDTCITSD